MPTTHLLPVARPRLSVAGKAFMLLLASCLTARLATAQATTAAAAANADMLSWMAHGLLAAVAGLTVLTCLVLLIAFTTDRRTDARPLAPAAAEPANSLATTLAEFMAAAPTERVAA